MFDPDKAYEISDPTLTQIENTIRHTLKSYNLRLLNTEFLSLQLPSEVAENLRPENHNEGTQYLHGI